MFSIFLNCFIIFKVMLEMLRSENNVQTTSGHDAAHVNKDEALNKTLNDFASSLDFLMDKQSTETKGTSLVVWM